MRYISVLCIFIYARFGSGSFYDYRYGDGYISDGGEKASDWQSGLFSSGRMSQPKCIDIPKNLTLCQNLGYDQMRIPNLLQHDSINEVIQQSKSWISLLGVHCHPDTKLFLCSLFSPVCLERDREIYPCRSLCESVRNGCESTMSFYGYKWPDMVRCDKFPEETEMCIRGQSPSTEASMYDKPTLNCQACNQPNTFEGLIHNYCRSTFVVRAKIKTSRIRNENTIIYLKKKMKVVKGSLSKKDKRNLHPYIPGGAECVCNILSSNSSQKNLIVMGNATDNGEFTVTFIAPWARDKGFRKAVRMMKKGITCNDDIIGIYQSTKTENPSTGDSSKGNGKKSKGKGNKRKGNGNKKNKKGNKKKDRKTENNKAKP